VPPNQRIEQTRFARSSSAHCYARGDCDMNEESPIYNPSYDSPLEDIFAFNIVKYLDHGVSFRPQVEVNTICEVFRVDFMVQAPGGKKIVFECDGKEFHDAFRDEWRDAMILGAGEADIIYRLRGSTLCTIQRMSCILCLNGTRRSSVKGDA